MIRPPLDAADHSVATTTASRNDRTASNAVGPRQAATKDSLDQSQAEEERVQIGGALIALGILALLVGLLAGLFMSQATLFK